MAYQENLISSLDEIPSRAAQFAVSVGWIVTGTLAAPQFKRPDDAGALTFRLTATASGADHRLALDGAGNVLVASSATLTSPTRKVGGAETAMSPIKVHLIGSVLTTAYLALVVEYPGSVFRHLYMGNMVKTGNYSGGECISGTGLRLNVVGSGSIAMDDPQYRHLFSATSNGDADVCGGINIQHADNPTQWRQFRTGGYDWGDDSFLDPSMVMGGPLDAINTGYVWRGRSSYASMSVMAPVNLYMSRPGANLSPVGYPPGVRLINMADMRPGTLFALGPESWRVFPAFCKSSSLTSGYSDGVATDETSGMLGYAYRTA